MPQPWGWEVEVGIRKAGQRKTVPGSLQQNRGQGGLHDIALEIRKWAWTL